MAKLTKLDIPTEAKEGVKRHTDPDDKSIVLPLNCDHDTAVKALLRDKEAMETYVLTSPVYLPYLLDDGLVAADAVMRESFGISFSSGSGFNPPESKSVKVSLTQAVEVPVGKVAIPSLGDEACVHLSEDVDPNRPDLGNVFVVRAYVKRKDQPHITKFVADLEARLRSHSIYRGKAVRLTKGGAMEFVDVNKYSDPSRIVFNASVQEAIDSFVLGPLRERDRLIARGVPLKRTTLGYGEFGTGKSSLGGISARVAIDTGHTYLEGGPAVDAKRLMQVGALYEPIQVFVEDVDNITNVSEADEVSPLLEAFDGLTMKGADIKLLMTTNYPDRIHPGMFRPGRIDNWLYIGPSDRPTMERLIRVNINEAELADEVDFDALWNVIEGFTPAYIHEVLNKAIIAAVVKSRDEQIVVGTDNLLAAAEIVKAQWQLQQEAVEPPKPPTIDRAIREVILSATSEVETSEAVQTLNLEAAVHGTVAAHQAVIRRQTRNDLEEFGNKLALYDKYGDDKKGQLVVE